MCWRMWMHLLCVFELINTSTVVTNAGWCAVVISRWLIVYFYCDAHAAMSSLKRYTGQALATVLLAIIIAGYV